jgi:hypothetical protein
MSDDPNAAPAPAVNVERAENVNATADPPPPTQASWDRIWLIIIGCFALICLMLVGSVIVEFVRSEGRVVDTATLKELFLFSGGFLTGVLARHLSH